MRQKIRYWKLGTDPEYGHWDLTRRVIYDLSPLVAHDRDERMACFVGTDGHASTSELRPGPTRNVYFHLAKIADGICQAQTRLSQWSARKSGLAGVAMAASPVIEGEVLGGHIHLSFTVEDSLLCELNKFGLVPETEAGLIEAWYGKKVTVTKEAIALLTRYAQGPPGVFTVYRFINTLRYLLEPFENAMFYPHNGARSDPRIVHQPLFRMANEPTKEEKGLVAQARECGRAYYRLEYRQPSTWLRDPLLAYCYLALAKFSLLNHPIIPSAFKNRPDERPIDTFRRRFAKIEGRHPRWTPDLLDLHTLPLKMIGTRDQPHPWLIDTRAWERYRAS